MSSHDDRTQLLTGGGKALMVINGGGIVALLSVLAKLFPMDTAGNKFYASVILCGIGCLTIGLILAVANYYFRHWASHYWDHGKKHKWKVMYNLENMSVIFSFLSFVIATLGIVVSMLIYINK